MQVTVNDTLQFSYASGFRVADNGENGNYTIVDDKKHVAISVAWNKPNPLFGVLLNVRFALRGVENSLRRTNTKFKRLEYMQAKICGQKTLGFDYLYKSGQEDRAGIAMVFKYQGTFYYIYYNARQDDGYATHKVFSQFLTTVKIAGQETVQENGPVQETVQENGSVQETVQENESVQENEAETWRS